MKPIFTAIIASLLLMQTPQALALGGEPTAQPIAKEKSPILSPEVSAKDETPKDVEAARLRGAATAATDIKAGTLRILYSGIQVSEHKDENTGYRSQHIGSGCLAGAAFSAEVDAYNQAMRDRHAKNPTPDKQ